MSLNTVCRACLAMDVPMFTIAGTPLQNIYEKLTGISLNAAHQSAMACYICYAQLRKSHNLMVRSLKADEVLTQFLRSGEAVQRESVSMLNQKTYQLRNALTITPTKIIDVTSTEEDLIEVEVKKETSSVDTFIEIEIKKELMTSEYIDEKMFLRSARLKFEQSEDVKDASREVLEDIKSPGRTDEQDIKREELHLSNCSTLGHNIGTEKMIDNENMILCSLPPPKVVSVDWNGEEHMKSNAFEGPASDPVDKCEQTYAVRIEYKSMLPPRRNLTKIQKPCSTVIKEVPSRYSNIRTYTSKTISTCSDTAINRCDVGIGDGDDCTSTNRDVGNTSSEQLRNMFICDACGDVFDDKCLLIEHNDIEHNVTGNIRKQRFTRTSAMTEGSDSRSEIFECEICKIRFTHNYKLRRHLRIHAEKPYECEICKGKFSYKCNLKTHSRIHTGEKPYECEICKFRFSYKSNLKTHLRFHTGEKPYQCEVCKARFSHNYKLEKHVRIHTGQKPYQCEICKVRLTEKSTLKAHLRKHTGEKPYKCDICDVRFNLKKSLQYHLRTHTGEKPYECEICKVRFIQICSLKAHLKRHTDEKPYECHICKLRFSQKGRLNRHVRNHTRPND